MSADHELSYGPASGVVTETRPFAKKASKSGASAGPPTGNTAGAETDRAIAEADRADTEAGPATAVFARLAALGSALRADAERAAYRAVGLANAAAAAAGAVAERCLAVLAAKAGRRGLAPNSLTGISVLLAGCAAAWLSGGTTRQSLVGGLAILGWLIARAGAKTLAAAYGAGAFAWPFAVATVAGESAVYGGVAAGGGAAGWPGMWPLATATVIAVAVTELVGACRDVPIRRWAGWLAGPPAGARVLLALSGLALRGPRIGLFCVLVAEVLSLCVVLARLGRLGGRGLPTTVRACRDDGAVARWAGRLVRGSLPPLPAAIAGTCATVLLAILGLRTAVGFISLAPVVALMLAAPGAGNPHEGRFDWLVPAVMALGQYVYLAALGVAWSVPAPIVFILCALTAAWYAGLAAYPGGPPGIGWEVRLTLAGLAAVFGIATVGYVVLATYLAVLIGRRALAVSEDAVDRPGARGWGQQAASPGDRQPAEGHAAGGRRHHHP